MTIIESARILFSDGFDEASKDGCRDGDVAGGNGDRKNFGEGAEDRCVDGMVEPEGLEHAPETVVEVVAKHDHGNDIEERDGPKLEAGDDIVVDIMVDEWSAGMDYAEGEMEQVENDEGEDDGAAPGHGAGGVGGMRVDFFNVGDRTGGALKKNQLPGGPDVQKYGKQKGDAGPPEKRRHGVQRGGIVIELLSREIDLQIAEEMGDNETEKEDTGDGHDGLLAEGGLPEAQIGGRKRNGGSTHGV